MLKTPNCFREQSSIASEERSSIAAKERSSIWQTELFYCHACGEAVCKIASRERSTVGDNGMMVLVECTSDYQASDVEHECDAWLGHS